MFVEFVKERNYEEKFMDIFIFVFICLGFFVWFFFAEEEIE